jgi:hypothetical protein
MNLMRQRRKITKSATVKRALEQIFEATKGQPSPFDLGREFFERNLHTKPTHDVARHSKKLLRSLHRLR